MVLFVFSVFPMNVSSVPSGSRNNYGLSGLVTQSSTNQWPKFHHDLTHTGYSTSTAPTTNQTLSKYTISNSVNSSHTAADNARGRAGPLDDRVYAFGTLPLSVSVAPSSSTIDVSQSQPFTSIVAGGTPPYSYQWYLNSAPVSGANSATWTFNATSAGSYAVYLKVTDAASAVATSNTSTVSALNAYFSVDPALSLFTTPSMVVGSTFDVNVSLVNATNVGGVEFYLTWDPTLLSVTHMTEILFHTKTPSAYWGNIWSIGWKKNNTAGIATYAQTFEKLDLAASDGYAPLNVTKVTDPPEGKLAAATLTFQVLKVPTIAQPNLTCAFNLSIVVLGDLSGNPISVGGRDGAYVIRLPTHDVGVASVLPYKTVVCQGYSLNVTLTAADSGDYPETFNITAYANATIIGSESVTLPAGNSMTVTFIWNTTGFAYGNYSVWAYAWPVQNETNTADNTFINGHMLVTIQSDVNGDGKVDILDVIEFGTYFGLQKGDARWNPDADINQDGVTNILDAIIIAEHFGMSFV
jgi:hypothetical protein